MSKNIILQHWVGEIGPLEKASLESIKEYANSIDAEHRLLLGDVFHPGMAPQTQKVHMLDEEFDEYDVVVMTDTDMFRRKGATGNIFTDETGFGRHTEIQTKLRAGMVRRWGSKIASPSHPYWGGSTTRWPREIRQLLRKFINIDVAWLFNDNRHDEGLMHYLAYKANLSEKGAYFQGKRWNWGSFEDGVETADLVHIRPKVTPKGPKRPKWENYQSLVERGIL